MTDNDIIKGLEHCSSNGECKDCPANPRVGNCGHCMNGLMKATLDLINRQKAEIESMKECERILICQLAEEREKAIKEFAERLKTELYYLFDELIPSIAADRINSLVKEMTEETKND